MIEVNLYMLLKRYFSSNIEVGKNCDYFNLFYYKWINFGIKFLDMSYEGLFLD